MRDLLANLAASGWPFVLSMIGVGVLTGCLIAIACMAVTLVASNPWLPIVVFGAFYGVVGLMVGAGKL